MIASPRLAASKPVRPARRGSWSWQRLIETLERWVERHRQRRALLEMSDHLLKDIGISRADAWQEAHKPFWR